MLHNHLIVILVAVVLGLFLLNMGRESSGMNLEQRTTANRYRTIAYVLFALAAGVAVYYYVLNGKKMYKKKAKMCGARYRY